MALLGVVFVSVVVTSVGVVTAVACEGDVSTATLVHAVRPADCNDVGVMAPMLEMAAATLLEDGTRME